MELEKRPMGWKRLEVVYLVYLAFFVLAVMTPSIIARGHFGVSEPVIEEILIFLFGIGGLMTFLANERYLESRIKERDQAIETADRAKTQLVESYAYIGSMNRHMDLLKKLVNETSLEVVGKKAYWKDLLQSLTANACAVIGAKSVLLRILELDQLRTEREVWHFLHSKKPFNISNRSLRDVHDSSAPHQYLDLEKGDGRVLIVPSDRRGGQKAYLIFQTDADVDELEISLLKVFANHAEMVHHLLQRRGGGTSPLDKVEDVASMTVGEVG